MSDHAHAPPPASAKNAADACRTAAERLTPRVRDLAPAIDAERRLPPELVQELVDARLFHLLLPDDLGGLEADPITAAQVVETLSRADGSTGWCVMIAAQTIPLAGFMAPVEARRIWGEGGIVAGSARPQGGRAVWTEHPEPGYRVSGRWPFASGSSHATWFAGECFVYDGETQRQSEHGEPVTAFMFVPRAQVRLHDTWDSLGLRGTASHDFSMEGVFVPERHGVVTSSLEPRHPWALYRTPPLWFINHGAQALGVARAAIATATEIAATKLAWGTDRPLREQPRLQGVLAEAAVLVDSAALYLYDMSHRLWQASLTDSDDPRLRAQTRLAASHAVRAGVRAVDLMHAAVATTAVFRKSPLERQFRDVHTAAAHVMVSPLTYEAAGRALLGLAADMPFF